MNLFNRDGMMSTNKTTIFSVFLFIFSLAPFRSGYAGETGKISGQITDKETGEPLAGVNVVIENRQLGASTDENGIYFVLQLPPGTYSLSLSYLGYRDVRVENVRVSADLTTRIDAVMETEVLELEENIVIVAERPVIQKDVTSSTQFVDIEELTQLPVTNAEDAIFLQTGVLFDGLPMMGGLGAGGKGETRYAVRGGSQDEVKWYINGVRTSSSIDARADRGNAFTFMNLDAIQEVQVITGGFNAEYGEAQSGIVNVITKEGGDRFSGSAEFIYGLEGQHHFGNYIYDPDTQKEFIDNTDSTGNLDPDWWTDYRKKQVYDYTKNPDRTLYLSLGGPLFNSGTNRGTFFVSSQLRHEAYAFPRPRDARELQNFVGNFVFSFGPRIKLRLSGMYNHESHSTLQETADFTNQAKYYRGWGSLLDTYTYSFSAQLTHIVSQDLFYDLKLSNYLFDFKESPSDFTALGVSANPTIWGYQRYDGYPDEPFDAYAFIFDNHSKAGDVSLIGSINWQFDVNNLLKAGLEFRYHTYHEISTTRFPSYSDHPDDWLNRGMHEEFHPIQFAAFIQDKMEFESMILNLGVRYDYYDPNRDWFINSGLFNYSLDPEFDPAMDPDGNQIDSLGRVKYSFANVLAQPRAPAKSYHMISPRIGVSFPVTENTLLHFNYGHFRQMPPLDRMFEFTYFRPEYIVKAYKAARENGTELDNVPSNEGDPERVVSLTLEPLRPEKTIMFEVGVKQNFGDFAVLDITAFYKDVFDQNEPRMNLFDRRVYGYDPFRPGGRTNVFFVSTFPGDYGDSRGFEIALRSVFSRMITFDVNYSFSVAISGRASPGRIDLDQNGDVTYTYDTDVELRIPVEKSFSRPHVLRANLFFNYPYGRSDTWWAKIIEGGSASLLYKFTSGQAFTYLTLTDPPDTYDNYRYPPIQTFDLRLEKMFNLSNTHAISVYALITNLFNTKNLRSYGDIFFDADATKNYVEKGEVSTVDGFGYDISYQTYYEPRRYYFGVRYSF